MMRLNDDATAPPVDYPELAVSRTTPMATSSTSSSAEVLTIAGKWSQYLNALAKRCRCQNKIQQFIPNDWLCVGLTSHKRSLVVET